MKLADLKTIANAIVLGVGPQLRALSERVAELETQAQSFKDFGYVGIWRDGNTYQRGNFCTDNGAMWHCERKNVTTRPGTNGDDWRLCVKSPRQAR